MTGKSPYEPTFKAWCHAHGLPEPEFEYRFHPERKWRFDVAWPAALIGMEIDGGVWTKGRHVRGAGFLKDIEKLNNAARLGWRVLRVVPGDLFTKATADMLHDVVGK